MSFAKTHLKAARDGISKKDYAVAKKEASLVLDYEPDNYNANVFLGLALLELAELEPSEQAYRKAIQLNPSQPLAWQGLLSYYVRRKDIMKQEEVLKELVNLFNKAQDATKCAEMVQKLLNLYREDGTKQQIIEGLSYFLPESPCYTLLSSLPPPDSTNPTATTTFEAQDAVHNGYRILQEVVSLTESLEDDFFKKEVEKRRMRLGAPSPEVIRKEVFLETFKKSKLSSLYESILNHPNTSDDARVEVEAKQLRYKQQYLQSLPSSKEFAELKEKAARELDDIIDGIVLLQKPDELGWRIFLETRDYEHLSDYELDHIRGYIRLFPDSGLGTLFRAYYAYKQESLVQEGDENSSIYSINDDDPVDTILNVTPSLSDTILGSRVLADVYFNELDYENAIKISKQCLKNISKVELDMSKKLPLTRIGLQVILSSSLVHFFSPKHHPEASRILDEILTSAPDNTSALMSRAYILQASSEWQNAATIFDKVYSLLPDDFEAGLRAREESAWCICQLGQYDESLQELQSVLDVLEDLQGDGLNSERARCMWRIGKCHMAIGGDNMQSAYKCFINALKQDSEFAPAFTSLGIYYLEHATPPDPIRASKCFQKAFELDPRETVAARRLAEGFANDREWDLVEVVAQRTIDGEGGLNAGMNKSELEATSRYLPTNSWAWKALGIVKFHYRDYTAAIQSFQISLRVEPEDQSLWVRLGEAYSKAGRHVAALKALNHALEIKPDDWLCSFIIAEVNHSMGLFEEAISSLQNIRSSRPDEAGVLALLGQAYLDLGRSEVSDGYQVRAEASFSAAIGVAQDMIQRSAGFRHIAWKVIGDAAYELSCFSTYIDELKVRSALQNIAFPSIQDDDTNVAKIIAVPDFSAQLTPLQVVSVAIHAARCQISLSSQSEASHATSWYDLGIALHSWTLAVLPSVDTSAAKEKVIECIKKALQLDASNDIYWVALGNAYFHSHPKAAQHAYIRAIEIDAKNANVWVNLGLLYAYHSDLELANEAFYRAQVLDPDNTLAWVGQFLLATLNGHKDDATLLLEHAVGLSSPVPQGDYEFASQTFEVTRKAHQAHQIQDALLPAFFVLNRFVQRRPRDPSGLHLLSLVCERLGHSSLGQETVEQAIQILESAYEETEDPEVEKKYTIANITLGRLKLSQEDYDGSIGSFESALGLLADKEDDQRSAQVLKVQSHLGMGLAYFMQGNLETALGSLEDGLECAGDKSVLRGHVKIMLAKTLWAIGTDEAKETAKSRLLESIASDPENFETITALAGMGILTNDDGLVDAALSEILALSIDQKHKLDPLRHVDYLLMQNHLAQDDTKHATSIAQQAVHAEPSGLGPRNRLASLLFQNAGATAAEEALAVLASGAAAKASNGLVGDVDAALEALSIEAVAKAAIAKGNQDQDVAVTLGAEALRKAQRAIMLHPSTPRGWDTLAYARAGSATWEETSVARRGNDARS